jgi:hypothetical protein
MANTAIDSGLGLPMSRADYRRWAEAQPSGRFERIDGLVVAMAPDRLSHVDRKSLVWLALRRPVAAAGLPCHVYGDGATVEVDDNDFEADAVLCCGAEMHCRVTGSRFRTRLSWWRCYRRTRGRVT